MRRWTGSNSIFQVNVRVHIHCEQGKSLHRGLRKLPCLRIRVICHLLFALVISVLRMTYPVKVF